MQAWKSDKYPGICWFLSGMQSELGLNWRQLVINSLEYQPMEGTSAPRSPSEGQEASLKGKRRHARRLADPQGTRGVTE